MPRALSEIAQVNPQVNLPAGAVASTPVSFVPMSDVTESGDWVGRQVRSLGDVRNGFTVFADGDVLVAKITPCFENGKGAHVVGLTNGVGFGSTEFHVLRARDGVSPRFVHHVTQSARLRRAAEAYMSGSAGQRRVPREFFDVFNVPDLSPPEQQQIGIVLDTLDTTIRQTEAIIEKLKQVKQGLLHDLLTRGIDANGELRPPQSQAPHLYKYSPLGWIPREWEISTVGQQAELLVGPAFESHRFVTGANGVRLLRGINVSRGFIRWDESITARWRPDDPFVDRYRLCVGDVVVGMDGALVGRNVAKVMPDDVPSLLVQRVTRIRPAGELGDWIRMNIQSDRFLHHIDGVKTHTAIPHITGGNIADYVIPLPCDEEVGWAMKRMLALIARITTEQVLYRKLGELKTGLMDDLLTGRVRVTPLLA